MFCARQYQALRIVDCVQDALQSLTSFAERTVRAEERKVVKKGVLRDLA
jgi:hypothetical protein